MTSSPAAPLESALAEAMAQHDGCHSRTTAFHERFDCGFVYTYGPSDDFGHARRAHVLAAIATSIEAGGKCIHVPPSPGQSLCQCKHQQIEMEYAARIAEAQRGE